MPLRPAGVITPYQLELTLSYAQWPWMVISNIEQFKIPA